MKFVRLATITALSAVFIAGGTSAFAAEIQNPNTDANVEFSATDEDGNGPEVDVTNPDPDGNGPDVDIPPLGPDNTGPLTITYAPTMNFGKQVISNEDIDYSMVAEQQPLTGGEEGETVPYVSFAQVQDTRGTNAGWDLRVSLSDFTADEDTLNDTLYGAQIQFISPRLDYIGNEGNEPEIHQEKLILNAGEDAESVLSAAEGKGAGKSSVIWGDQEAIDAQDPEKTVLNDNIKLHVPGNTSKDAVNYKATLSWELTQAPGKD